MRDVMGGACFLFIIRLVLSTLHILSLSSVKHFYFSVFLLYQNLVTSENLEEKKPEVLSNSIEHERPDPDRESSLLNIPDAESKIRKLEAKLLELEARLTGPSAHTKFPSIKFRTYKNRKRILVTGGAGFVGSHLVDTLMMDGHEVFVADNYFTGSKRNIEQWLGHENFEMLHHDIVNPLYIEVDEIYHLASPASPPHYMYNPVKTIKTNTVGTVNMLGLAKRTKARILIASTSEVSLGLMIMFVSQSHFRFMATLRSILSLSPTGATSTPSVPGLVTTKVRGWRRPWPTLTTSSPGWM